MPDLDRFFVCYRREDPPFARLLYELLVARSGAERVFMDLSDMVPGELWRARIADELARCPTMFVLVGLEWMAGVDAAGKRIGIDDPVIADDPVVVEIEAALKPESNLNRGLNVVPVVLPGASMPDSQDLPGRIRQLAEHHVTKLGPVDPRGDLVSMLDRVLPGAPPPDPPPKPSLARRLWWWSCRWWRQCVAGAAALTAVGVIVWWTGSGDMTVTATTDPCAFVSTADLSDLGVARLMPEYGSFAGCSAVVERGGVSVIADVELTIPEYADPAEGSTDERYGEVAVARDPCSEQQCRGVLRIADTPREALVVSVRSYGAEPMAELGAQVRDAAVVTAAKVLAAGPFPERPPLPEGSFGTRTACSLLNREGTTDGFGGLSCDWGNPTGTVVGIGFARVEPGEVPREGGEWIAGRLVFVDGAARVEEDGRLACGAGVPGVEFTARDTAARRDVTARVEVVHLLVRRADAASPAEVCADVRALAAAVVPLLPGG